MDLEALEKRGLLGEAAYCTDEEIESQRGKEKWPQAVQSRFSHRDQEIVGKKKKRERETERDCWLWSCTGHLIFLCLHFLTVIIACAQQHREVESLARCHTAGSTISGFSANYHLLGAHHVPNTLLSS